VKKFVELIRKGMESLLIFITAAMCIIVFWQVFSRFILNSPSSWSEEIARCLMIWLGFLGGALGIRAGVHIALDYFVNRIPLESIRKVIKIFTYGLCVFFGWVLFRYGIDLIKNGIGQRLMSINLQMSFVYSIVPVSGFLFMWEYFTLAVIDIHVLIGRVQSKEKK
jgi:TRAP-type C4-dicarboxylate transport system permease small subunit